MTDADPPPGQGAMGDEILDFLASVPLFESLPRHLLRQVGDRCGTATAEAGAWLFRQGEEGGTLFVLRTGRVELIREAPAPEVVLGVAGPGEAVGELGLLIDRPHTASVRAIRDCVLLRLDRAALLEVLGVSPDFAAGLLRALGQRLRAVGASPGQRGKRPAIIAVVGADGRVPLRAVADGLVAAFASYGPAVAFDGTDATASADGGDRVAAWGRHLDGLERSHLHVVLVATPEAGEEWGRFCARHADRVVAATTGDRAAASAVAPGSDLLFWGSPRHITGLDRWLDTVRPRGHHFVDPRQPEPGLARIGRRLTGTAVGVVLPGGGARSLAAIGALEELGEAGVAIDRIGGSGFGSLVAAMFAVGLPPAEMVRRCRDEFVVRRVLADYTLPRTALLRGRRYRAMLERVFGTARVEAVERSLFCVSADLETARAVVHRRGALAPAVAASTALPGLLPPVALDGRVLCDGSVLDNVPVSVMVAEDEGPVFVVDVRLRRWAARRTGDEQLPRLIDTMLRAGVLGGSQGEAEEHRRAQVVLRAELPGVGQLDFGRLDEIVEAGRRAVRTTFGEAPWTVDTLAPVT